MQCHIAGSYAVLPCEIEVVIPCDYKFFLGSNTENKKTF